jgi:hypothetical protein
MKRIMMLALAAAVTLTSAGALHAQGKGKDKDKDRGHDKGRTEVMRHPNNGRRVGPSPYGPGRRVGPWGAGGVLERRVELRLTNPQITRLNAIQRRWDDRNRLLLPRVTPEGLGRTDADRDAYYRSHPDAREADEALRKNREAERKEVDAVLTTSQRSKYWKE